MVDVIKKYRQDCHLLDMLTEVNRRVAEIVSDEPGGKQQIPAPINTFRAQVYLKDLWGDNEMKESWTETACPTLLWTVTDWNLVWGVSYIVLRTTVGEIKLKYNK